MPDWSFHRHTLGKARRKPFNRTEKTGLTRAAKIAPEWQNAELRHLAQASAWQLRATSGSTGLRRRTWRKVKARLSWSSSMTTRAAWNISPRRLAQRK